MNGLYFLIPFLLIAGVGLVQDVSAERLEDSEIIENPDGSFTHTLGLPPYINTVNGYQPFVFTEDNVFLTVETGHGSVRLNKNTCGFGIYEGGYIETPIFDILGNEIGTNIADPDFNSMINAWKKNNNGPAFQNMASLNGGSCVTSWDGENLSATQTLPGTAEKTVTFTLQNYNWKTTYEITNLDSQSNIYSFKELLDIEGDSFVLDGDEKSFSTYSGQTFNKEFLDSNNGQQFQFGENYYDFDVGYEFVDGIKVLDNGLELSFVSPTINPLETWIVDPTFGYFLKTGNMWQSYMTDGTATTTCDGNDANNAKVNNDGRFRMVGSGASGTVCYVVAIEWDLSHIPDTAVITDSVWRFDVSDSVGMTGLTCNINAITSGVIENQTATELWDDIYDGSGDYVANNGWCDVAIGNDYTQDLGTTADSDITTDLTADDRFAIGLEFYDWTRDISGHWLTMAAGQELLLTYNMPPDPPKQLFGNAYDWYGVDMTWAAGATNGDTHQGYLVQRYNETSSSWVQLTNTTSLYYLDNNPIQDQNTTKYRIYDDGALGIGCPQPVLNGTLAANLVSHWHTCYTLNDNGLEGNALTVRENEIYNVTNSNVYFNSTKTTWVDVALANEADYDFLTDDTKDWSVHICFVNDYDLTANQVLFLKGHSITTDSLGMFFNTAEQLVISYAYTNTSDEMRFGTTLGNSVHDGSEYCITLVHDSNGGTGTGKWSEFDLFWNGTSIKNVATFDTKTTNSNNNNELVIGSDGAGNNEWVGLWRNVMIFNATLDAHQDQQLTQQYIDTRWQPFAIDTLTATVVDLDTVRLDFSDPTDWESTNCYDINYTTPLGDPTTVAQNCTPVAGAYLIDGLNTFDNAYSFRMGVENDYGLNATGNIANVTAFNVFEIGSINVPTGDNPNILPITFVEYQDNSTQTTLQVIFDSSYNLSCNFGYVFGQTNQTYSGLSETTISGSQVYHNFTLTNPENEITNVYCWDSLNNATDGRYLIDQTSIPFFNQIDDFETGVFGPSGMFGIFDFATLIIVIVSMIGFNRYNPALGVITMVCFIGVMTYYEVIAWQSSLIGVSALVLMLAIMQVRKP